LEGSFMTTPEINRMVARLRCHQKREEAAQQAAMLELREQGLLAAGFVRFPLKQWICAVRAILAKHGLSERTSDLL
jgi:hypothetical protein